MTQYFVFGEDTDWTKVGNKVGGRKSAGSEGGVYQNGEGKKALIKRDNKNFANISEYLGGALFEELTPGHAPKISLAIPKDQDFAPSNGKNVYIHSEFFNNYTDMYVDIQKELHGAKEVDTKNRTLFMGTRETLTGELTKAFTNLKYQNFNEIAAGSLLIGDFDMHVGNIGVIRDKDKDPYLVRIDFGNAFRKLTDKVHPHSIKRHLPLLGATNHFREFPDYLKNNDGFANELLRLSNKPLSDIIDKKFSEVTKYYNKDAIGEWANKMMPDIYGSNKKEIDIDDVKSNFKLRMSKRQESLKEYAIQIKLGLLIEKDGKNYSLKDKSELTKLVNSDLTFFENLMQDSNSFKFRDKKFGTNAKKFILTEIDDVLQAQYSPSAPPMPPIIGAHRMNKERYEPPLSPEDYVLINESVYTKNTNRSLTQIIREEVIAKQQEILEKYALESDLNKISHLLPNKKPNPEFTQELQKVQQEGYKKFHEAMELSNPVKINWQSSDKESSVKEFNIKDQNNNDIPPTLKMREMSEGVSIGGKEVKNSRHVELPLKLNQESPPGEMHISLALRDAKGNAAPKDLGLFFTAHYEKGKLVEVSAPLPIKFTKTKEGKEIGYIEHKGNIYTMPVDPALHREMVKEVKKNQGSAIDVSPDKSASSTKFQSRISVEGQNKSSGSKQI